MLRLKGGKPVVLLYNFNQNENLNVSLSLNNRYWVFSDIYPMPESIKQDSNNDMNTIQWPEKCNDNCVSVQTKDGKRDYAYLFWEALTSNPFTNIFFINQLTRGNNFYCFKSEEIEVHLEKLLRKRRTNNKEIYDFFLTGLVT